MSKPLKAKDGTDMSNIFSIDLENEESEVPSITKLTEMLKEKKAPLPPGGLQKSSHSNVPRLTPATTSRPVPGLTARPAQAVPDYTHTNIPTAKKPAVPSAKPTRLPSISSIAVRSEESRIMELAKPKTLAELGVQAELLFEPERGSYRYVKMKPHARDTLALWQQKFYFQMKLDLKTLEVFGTFQEFNKNKHSFQAEAFALTDCDYVQIVRLESIPQKIFVLLSKDSLVEHEALVKKMLEEAANPPADDFKIEMAS